MIHLERLTWDNYDDVLKLKVAKEQKEYIVPNSDSLIHAFFAMTENKAQIFPFGIYLGKTPVGFMMIARDVPWIEQYYGSPAKYYYIWRFMIDKRYQGNGYGKENGRQYHLGQNQQRLDQPQLCDTGQPVLQFRQHQYPNRQC